jgi:hypothetical protein
MGVSVGRAESRGRQAAKRRNPIKGAKACRCFIINNDKLREEIL